MNLYRYVPRKIRWLGGISVPVLLLAVVMGCQSEAPVSPEINSPEMNSLKKSDPFSDSGFDETLLKELSIARKATAAYHNLDKAEDKGYGNIFLFIPKMGNHYVNGSLVDNTFEVDKPEALVYYPMPDGKQKLVAVEYLAPVALYPDGPPEGFSGDKDHWHTSPDGVLWTLHVWLWMNNRDGMFEEFNPDLP